MLAFTPAQRPVAMVAARAQRVAVVSRAEEPKTASGQATPSIISNEGPVYTGTEGSTPEPVKLAENTIPAQVPQFAAIIVLALVAAVASNAILSSRDMVDVKTLVEYREIFATELKQ